MIKPSSLSIEDIFEEYQIQEEAYARDDQSLRTILSEYPSINSLLSHESSFEDYSLTRSLWDVQRSQTTMADTAFGYFQRDSSPLQVESQPSTDLFLQNANPTGNETQTVIKIKGENGSQEFYEFSQKLQQTGEESKHCQSKNFLANSKIIIRDYIDKEGSFSNNSVFLQFKKKPPSMKMFQLLFNEEEMRPFLAIMFYQGHMKRGIITSRASKDQKCTYMRLLPSILRAFKNRKFHSIK